MICPIVPRLGPQTSFLLRPGHHAPVQGVVQQNADELVAALVGLGGQGVNAPRGFAPDADGKGLVAVLPFSLGVRIRLSSAI